MNINNKHCMKVLVLGHEGMLGHMVVKYFRDQKINICTINKRWPSSQKDIKIFDGDYIVNCIGAIPQNSNDFDINWQLPIWLDLHAPCRIIHPGTDCEMDKDEYGVSKNIAAFYIRNLSDKTKSIKTSIIGPEIKGKNSLLEWYLRQNEPVYGYTQAIWNGNTTLEWSKHCLDMLYRWNDYDKETIIYSNPISKYELLKIFKIIFEKNISIKPKNVGKNKTLAGTIRTDDIFDQVVELKNYYYKEKK